MEYVRKTIDSMDGYVPGEQPRDRAYVKLNTNENPYPPSPRVEAALRGFDPARLRLYPDPVSRRLCETVAAVTGLTPDWVIAGNGSDDLLTILVRTFVDQGGLVAYLTPGYSLYPVLAQIQGAAGREIALDDDFDLPADLLEQADGAALLFLTRPNAPTGNAFARDRMRAICAAFAGIVVIDEAYADFAADNCLDFLHDFANVVVTRTCSKSGSLAGVRLGVALARPEIIVQMNKVKDSYNVNMITQTLATAAWEDQTYMAACVAKIRATRARLMDGLRRLGFRVLPSEANFVFAAPPMAAADMMQALRQRGFLVRYFPGPRTGDYLRITIGTDADMDAFIAAAGEILRAG